MKRMLILALTTAALTLPARAAGDGPHLPPGEWWRRPEVVRNLQLTEEQQRRLDSVSLASRKELIDLHAAVEKRSLDLREELDSDTLDRGRIQRAAAAVSEARGRLFERELMMMADLRSVLSVEQWKKLRSTLSERREERRDGRRGGAGDGQRRPPMRRMGPPMGQPHR